MCARNPKLPVDACANDNWMGRERAHVRNASRATKMLASLGRCRASGKSRLTLCSIIPGVGGGPYWTDGRDGTGPTDRDGWTDGETERTGRDETRQDGTGRSPGREGGGREIHVPYTSRCCWKQVRLGRASEETQQQKGLSGNTIFFAQPTAEVPSMELPPAPDGLVDTVNIILTRSVDDLSHAEWATVKRSEYMRIVRERKAQCPVFSEVKLADETRLPECGVPEHITACASTVEGAERAPSRLLGPASRAPEISKYEEADEATDASDSHDDKDAPVSARGACQPADGQDAGPDAAATGEGIAEASIAIDPTHHLEPAKMVQALRAQLDAVQAHAAKVWRDSEAAPYHTHPG